MAFELPLQCSTEQMSLIHPTLHPSQEKNGGIVNIKLILKKDLACVY